MKTLEPTLERTEPRHRSSIGDPTDFVLCCDEVHRFLGHDHIDGLATDRHLGLSHWLAVQDNSGLRNKQIDLLPKVISQCSVICSFRQTNPDDTEILGRLHAQAGLDFTKIFNPIHDGYDFYEVQEKSYGKSETHGVSHGTTEGESITKTQGQSSGTSFSLADGETDGVAEGSIWGRSHSDGKSTGWSKGESIGVSESEGENSGWSEAESGDRESGGESNTHGKSKGRNISVSGSDQTGDSVSDGGNTNLSRSNSRTVTNGHNGSKSKSIAIGKNRSRTQSESYSQGTTETTSHRLMPMQRYRDADTGKLVTSVSDQIEMMKTALVTQGIGECLVMVDGNPTVQIKTHHVPDVGCDSWKNAMLTRMKQFVYSLHEFYFEPCNLIQRHTAAVARRSGRPGMTGSSKGRKKPRS